MNYYKTVFQRNDLKSKQKNGLFWLFRSDLIWPGALFSQNYGTLLLKSLLPSILAKKPWNITSMCYINPVLESFKHVKIELKKKT